MWHTVRRVNQHEAFLRFNNHKSRLSAHTRLSPNDKLRDDLSYQHFHSVGHNELENLTVQLIDRVNDERDLLLDKEVQWEYRLGCIRPHCLNDSDFFYSQNGHARVGRK